MVVRACETSPGRHTMHRVSLLSVLLAAVVITSVAVAANDRVTANFESLAASGVTGTANLNPTKASETLVHGSLRGLAPNVEYVSLIYQNGTCTSGGVTTELARFRANPAGVANFNQKVPLDMSAIKSISVQRASESSLQACAAVGQ